MCEVCEMCEVSESSSAAQACDCSLSQRKGVSCTFQNLKTEVGFVIEGQNAQPHILLDTYFINVYKHRRQTQGRGCWKRSDLACLEEL